MKQIERGIQLITWGTAVRWFGWGLFETLLPVFFFSFSGSFAETGFFKSIYYVLFLFAAPLAGLLAERISAKTIIISGLLLYPFIGLSYFLAGATGIALYIVIARALNGIGYAFDSVGRSTYMRRFALPEKVSQTFGYFDVVTTFAWILAAGIGFFLLKNFTVHELALAIIPTTLVTVTMISLVKKDVQGNLKDAVRYVRSQGIIKSIWKEISSWSKGMRYVALVNFFLGFVLVVGDFIIPIRVFQESGDIGKVIIVGIVIAIPGIFDFLLGKFADLNRVRGLLIGLCGIVVLLFLLSFTENYVAQTAIAFLLSICGNLVNLSSDGIVTKMVSPEHYGRMSSINFDIDTLGTILGPIVIGLVIDSFNFSKASLVLSALGIVVFLVVFISRKKLFFHVQMENITE